MPAALVGPTGTKVESLEKQLERVEKDIEAVKRRKLVTIVGDAKGLEKLGPSDKVIFVEPLDLRGKDPEEDLEIIEDYVIETKWDNGFAQHITGKRPTGKFNKRGPSGPLGATYKIDCSNQNGKREWEEFKRLLDTHTNRLGVVPEPVPYHTQVNEQGHYDLRISDLIRESVPVAFLENYSPLQDLIKQKEHLLIKIREREISSNVEVSSASENVEDVIKRRGRPPKGE